MARYTNRSYRKSGRREIELARREKASKAMKIKKVYKLLVTHYISRHSCHRFNVNQPCS